MLACGASETKGYDPRNARQRPSASSSAKYTARGFHGENGKRARTLVRQHGAAWPCGLPDGCLGGGDHKRYNTCHLIQRNFTVSVSADLHVVLTECLDLLDSDDDPPTIDTTIPAGPSAPRHGGR